MSYYTMINRYGKHCGVKALTDAMVSRLEAGGWQVIPTRQPAITATAGRRRRAA